MTIWWLTKHGGRIVLEREVREKVPTGGSRVIARERMPESWPMTRKGYADSTAYVAKKNGDEAVALGITTRAAVDAGAA